MLAEIGGHKVYTVIDLSGAFQQLELGVESRELVTITTSWGLFQYARLPFGIKVAPAVFQSVMDGFLRNYEWCFCYLDDITVVADSMEEGRRRVHVLLKMLSEHNVKINLDKCQFYKEEIKFLGHVITKEGISADKEKIKVIRDADPPKDIKELQAFLGLVTYLHKFIPYVSEKLSPLLSLLKKGKKYEFGKEQENAFRKIKEELSEGKFLTHFDTKKEVFICSDASDVGIAAVLCHNIDGTLRPVRLIGLEQSRTLTNTEKRYPIICFFRDFYYNT